MTRSNWICAVGHASANLHQIRTAEDGLVTLLLEAASSPSFHGRDHRLRELGLEGGARMGLEGGGSCPAATGGGGCAAVDGAARGEGTPDGRAPPVVACSCPRGGGGARRRRMGWEVGGERRGRWRRRDGRKRSRGGGRGGEARQRAEEKGCGGGGPMASRSAREPRETGPREKHRIGDPTRARLQHAKWPRRAWLRLRLGRPNTGLRPPWPG